MKRTLLSVVTISITALSVACGGNAGQDTAAGDAAPAPAPAADTPAAPAGFSRASFVLCDALEPHRAELAGIVGFEQDAERALAVSASECVIRGQGGDFARVKLLPALVQSIAMHAESFDGEASPATELGDGAMYVADGAQPHVVFAMGPLFIDVNAEVTGTPSRETMIAFAERVRAILTDANS